MSDDDHRDAHPPRAARTGPLYSFRSYAMLCYIRRPPIARSLSRRHF